MPQIFSKDVETFVNGMANNSKTSLITAESELKKIVEKFGLDYSDTRDFGFFKNVYAVTDKANKNGAILPQEIVQSNLDSLRGKPIDINHEREKVRGFYLGGELVDNVIYSYGVIFKSSFKDDWKKAQELFEEGKLNTSFEIWCPQDKRTVMDDGSYTLNEITFAGGAILWDDTPPAFDEAVVLDFAEKNYVINDLVCAKEDIFGASVKKEDARKYVWNTSEISDTCGALTCSSCKKEYALQVDKIDYENEEVECSCMYCGVKHMVGLKPKVKIIKSAETKYNCECVDCGYKTKSTDHCKDTVCAKCGGTMRRAERPGIGNPNKSQQTNKEEAQMDELKQEVAELKAKLAEAEAKVSELEAVQAKLAEVEAAKAEVVEELTKANETLKKIDEEAKARKIAARKEEIGEFAKDVEDADFLNDDKFEMLKLKKENAELREKAEKASSEDPENADMTKGAKEEKGRTGFFKRCDDAYAKLSRNKQ